MEIGQVLLARDQRPEGAWVTAQAVIRRATLKEFLQVQEGDPEKINPEDANPGLEVAAGGGTAGMAGTAGTAGVSGAGEPPSSVVMESLLPGVHPRDVITLHFLSPGPGLKPIFLKTG